MISCTRVSRLRNLRVILGLVALGFLFTACSTTPSKPPLPPSASDLNLRESAHLCEPKVATLARWKGTSFRRTPWGTGEALQTAGGTAGADQWAFFDEDEILVGSVYRFRNGLALDSYPVLRQTLLQLRPTLEFFLNTGDLLKGGNIDTAALYRTGDKTSTTQYIVRKGGKYPVLLVAAVAIDPYEQLLAGYQEQFFPGLDRAEAIVKSGRSAEGTSAQDKDFLALQQFARGEAALFASCGQRRTDTAIAGYSKAIKHGFADRVRLAEAHHRLGLALRDKGRLQEAEEQLVQALRVRPDVPEVFNNLGTVLAQLGKRAEAMESFEKAIVLKPNYARARYNLAELYEVVNRKRAIEEYETYLALVEDLPEETGRAARARQRVKRLKGE